MAWFSRGNVSEEEPDDGDYIIVTGEVADEIDAIHEMEERMLDMIDNPPAQLSSQAIEEQVRFEAAQRLKSMGGTIPRGLVPDPIMHARIDQLLDQAGY